ncbi:hypothetical protein GGR57DRAFT_516893 [Xylariaceae sp. FL1272]|nr:hypothetical protein GGR57DRAFT_516893 [Xylariaceae sp. FL1272]
MSSTLAILGLPKQPLPKTGLIPPVSLTIWFFLCLAFGVGFDLLLRKRKPTTWPEFKSVLIGTALLSFWYFVAVLDRWLHYDQRVVVYGYIFVLPIFEITRVASSVYYFWGMYIVIWQELEGRLERRQRGYWWFAAKFFIGMVGLVSTYYAILCIAEAGAWVEFRSLNTIADIATKRTGFEIAMTVFFSVFGLITFAAASASLLWKARRIDGGVPKNRVFLLLSALILLIRSMFELALTARAAGPDATRQSLMPVKDVGYGVITILYLGCMYITARVISSGFDRGGEQARLVESDVRLAVLKQLQQVTEGGRRSSPPFLEIIDHVSNDLDTLLRDGPLSANVSLSIAHKQQAAASCFQKLRVQYGSLDPREGRDYAGSRSASGISSFFGRRGDQSRPRLSPTNISLGAAAGDRRSSDPVTRGNLRRTSNQSIREPASRRHVSAGYPPRAPSTVPTMNSMPSRWAAQVNAYPESVPGGPDVPLIGNRDGGGSGQMRSSYHPYPYND